jgi:hypothetical protein
VILISQETGYDLARSFVEIDPVLLTLSLSFVVSFLRNLRNDQFAPVHSPYISLSPLGEAESVSIVLTFYQLVWCRSFIVDFSEN